jgi:hypothetical protein
MKELSKHTRAELIQIIRAYNSENIIKNYHNLKKSDLIDLINKHIQFDNIGRITAKQLPIKVIEYDKFKKNIKVKKEKLLTAKQESRLAKERGKQRGKIMKLDDELTELKLEIERDIKMKNDKSFMKQIEDLNKIKDIEKTKLKTINDLFKKNEALIKKNEEFEKKVKK